MGRDRVIEGERDGHVLNHTCAAGVCLYGSLHKGLKDQSVLHRYQSHWGLLEESCLVMAVLDFLAVHGKALSAPFTNSDCASDHVHQSW